MSDDNLKPIERLHKAIQRFSNDLADEDSDVGMVMQGLVVWEETSFDEDGNQSWQVLYAVSGDAASLSGSVGLASIGLRKVIADASGREGE